MLCDNKTSENTGTTRGVPCNAVQRRYTGAETEAPMHKKGITFLIVFLPVVSILASLSGTGDFPHYRYGMERGCMQQRLCLWTLLLCAVWYFPPAALLFAQTSDTTTPRYYERRALYPNGRLEVGVLGFGTKYFGEFTDNKTGYGFGLMTRYALPFLPEIGIGARFTHGRLLYERRFKERFGSDFHRQFPEEDFPDAALMQTPRYTKITTGEVFLMLNLFPYQRLNYYAFGGGGVLSFQVQDIVDNPLNGSGLKLNYPDFKDESEIDFHFLGGIGIDYYVTSTFAVGLQGVYHVLCTDILDGYAQLRDSAVLTNPDAYAEFGLKLSYFLFNDNDTDNDGITNEREIELGTNPYEADTDGDGVNDYDEVDVYHSNPLSTDSDGDGVSDSEETTKHGTNPFSTDTDKDGLDDLAEITVYHTNPRAADSDNDGLNDKQEIELGSDPLRGDTDGDGIGDAEDRCPGVPGVQRAAGCPEPSKVEKPLVTTTVVHDTVEVVREIKTIEKGQSYTPYGINFKRGKAEIAVEAEIILDDVAKWLRDNPTLTVEIRGHTDADGSEEGNMQLSQQRAESVREYLILQGIDPDRLSPKGFGESWPVETNDTEKGRARNRRIEFYVKEK